MTIQFNTGPYFDDFDPANNFYRVLFKPGYAVQARELNQLQTILQHQISTVGNHLFKKNAIVIPGGISISNAADIVSVSGIADPSVLVGKTITNKSSFDPTVDSDLNGFITAVVLGYRPVTSTAPAALYIKYFKSQTDRSTFNKSETLKTVDSSLITFSVDSTVGSTVGKVATLSAGTFYTREIFVDVAQQSVILEVSSTTTTNCHVGLNIVETLVTSDDDETLLDNSIGTPNQYAPGADRYKISLELARIDVTTTLSDDMFIKLATIENNTVTFLNNKTQYSEIMKMIARRTYDANGNFIVRGLDTSVARSTDDAYVQINVTGGKCYLGGYEYEQLVTTPITIPKPRDTAHQLVVNPQARYTSDMPYFYLAGSTFLTEIPIEDSLVQFTNADPAEPLAQVVGYGVFKDIQPVFGTPPTNDVYKVFFDFISLEKGYTLDDIGGIKSIVSGEGAPILHRLKLQNIIGTFAAGNTIESATDNTQSGLIYYVSSPFVYVIKDTVNTIPNTDTVIDTTSNATAIRSTTFVTNYRRASYPLIEVDADTIKTMYNGDGINTTSYSIVRRDVFTSVLEGDTLSITLTGSDTFEDFSTSDYFAYITDSGSEEAVDLSSILTITSGGKKYEITVGSGSPMIGKTVWVYSTVNKVNAVQANKTKTTVTAGDVIATPSKSWMPVGKQDVVAITKIVGGKTLAIEDAIWDTDVATITTSEAHTMAIGNVVVVKGVYSDNNSTGDYNAGFNGKFTLTAVNLEENTISYALLDDPGAFTSTPSNDALVALPPDINNDTEITTRYTFDSGNTPYFSGTGMIKLRKGMIAPAGQIAVQYQYYSVGNGNYVSVDSYNTNDGNLAYIGAINNLTDVDGNVVELRRYIDFRTRPSSYFFKNLGQMESGSSTLVLRDLNLSLKNLDTTLVGKYVVGPSHLDGATITAVVFNPDTGNTELELSSPASDTVTGTYYIGLYGASLSLVDTSAGAKAFETPKDSTRISFQYTKFLPKQLMLYVNRDVDLLRIDYKEIASKKDISQYIRNEFRLPLAYVYMKPYTQSIDDVTLQKFENPVYQMLDIHQIKKRVDRNEYYSLLALNRDIEREAILAGTELTQSSRGLWAENFADVGNQDYNSDDFACTIYDKSYVAPGTVTRTVPLEFDSTLNVDTWQRSGTAITLPYTEVNAFSNKYASRFNNLNPYNAVNWSGKLVLNPSVDNWVDVQSQAVPTVSTTRSTSTSEANATTTATSTSSTTATATAPKVNVSVTMPPPPVIVSPPPVVPPPPVVEIVTQINNLRTSWGPDSAGGNHAITFDWVTNTGRTGRVNTDKHLSRVVKDRGFNGTFARSLINRLYNDTDVKEYLNAGTHFDQRPPSQW